MSKIGSILGVPLFADECITKQLRVSFARVLIELDVTKKLHKNVLLEDPNGRCMEQPVYYEWLPLFCTKCQIVGHECKQQQHRPKPQQPKKKWVPKHKPPGKESGDDKESESTPHSEDAVIDLSTSALDSEEDAVAGQEVQSTPVQAYQESHSDDDGGWKVITRRKDKHKRNIYPRSSSKQLHEIIEEEETGTSGNCVEQLHGSDEGEENEVHDPGENPYLS